MMRPLILISNDDGIGAKGLNFLIQTMRSMADIFVMAPDRARSGAGCSITSKIPISHRITHMEEGLTICSCTGTPTDCIKLALDQVLMRQPDLILGGINHGDNSSINAHYSGTMGIVFEGAMQGFPSIAFSLCNHALDADFSATAPYIQKIVSAVLEYGLPYHTCLNVNFPNSSQFNGIRICRMAVSKWQDEYTPCDHPNGTGHYFWLTGSCINEEPEETDTDSWALTSNYIAITPTQVDVTSYPLIETMKTWDL